jgi:hypothetical protein
MEKLMAPKKPEFSQQESRELLFQLPLSDDFSSIRSRVEGVGMGTLIGYEREKKGEGKTQ